MNMNGLNGAPTGNANNSTVSIDQSISGIDWSIFRDGEENAFGWLLRTNANFVPTTPRATHHDHAMTTAQPIHEGHSMKHNDVLPLEDIEIGDHETSLLGLESAHVLPLTTANVALHTANMSTVGNHVPNYANAFTQNEDQLPASSTKSSDEQSMTMDGASTTSGSRRLMKRKSSHAADDDDDEKKQQRRIKNLASVREFRKRKMKQLEQNEARLNRLEAENLDLKMRLKIGKDALTSEQREKRQIKEQMREMLKRNASEQEIAQFVNMYKITYSDYGPKRREKLQFHLSRIRELLLPTQVTKLCLYSVEQANESMVTEPRKSTSSKKSNQPDTEDDASSAPPTLWGILAKELDVSESQQRQILEHRASIQKVRDNLNDTLRVLDELERVTEEKNTALEAQVAQLQQILTPSQATKFIIWVKENPAFMYMLDKLVDSTLMTSCD